MQNKSPSTVFVDGDIEDQLDGSFESEEHPSRLMLVVPFVSTCKALKKEDPNAAGKTHEPSPLTGVFDPG